MGWINDLEAERDALRQKLADSQADYLRRHKDACDRAMELVDLRQQLAEAREALEPFARADFAMGNEPGPYRFETGTGYRELSRDDFRRAHAFLRALKESTPQPKSGGAR